MPQAKNKLTADAWAAAALDAIAEGGLKAVAVEPLARRLGVTKGSFYWHFANRKALVQAALSLWEHRATDGVIARVKGETDPKVRIHRLFREVDGSERGSRIYLALAAVSNDPAVDNLLRRVTERRLGFLRNCYHALGLSEHEIRHYCVLAYSTFLGTLQLRRDAPDALPQGEAFQTYLDFVDSALIPETRGGKTDWERLKDVS
jgi:AcrR family transcriptional regulator